MSETTIRYGLHFHKDHFKPDHPHLHVISDTTVPDPKSQKRQYREISGSQKSIFNIFSSCTGGETEEGGNKKVALLFGINYIGTANALNGCIRDVHNIKDALINKFGYKDYNITLMSDDQNGDMKPTRKNMIDQMKKAVGSLGAGDSLFIHYSGHGTQVPAVSNLEDLNPDSKMADALCPCDFGDYHGVSGFIPDYDLKVFLVNKIPKGAKLRVFTDACHSGSMLDLPFLFRDGKQFIQIDPLDENSPDCLLISGCKDNQTSADAYINSDFAGALTWSITTALQSYPKNKMTWADFLTIIRHNLVVGKYEQIPMLSTGDQNLLNRELDL